jgi:hypothetical protein
MDEASEHPADAKPRNVLGALLEGLGGFRVVINFSAVKRL